MKDSNLAAQKTEVSYLFLNKVVLKLPVPPQSQADHLNLKRPPLPALESILFSRATPALRSNAEIVEKRKKQGRIFSETKTSPHSQWEQNRVCLFFSSATNGNLFQFRSEASSGGKNKTIKFLNFIQKHDKVRACTNSLCILEFTNCRQSELHYNQKRMKHADSRPHQYRAGNLDSSWYQLGPAITDW